MTSWLVFTGMSSLVAKGSLGSSPHSAAGGHCLNFKLYDWRHFGANGGVGASLGFLNQVDLTHAAGHFQADGCGRFAVGIVGVLIAVMCETMSVDRADSAGSMHDHADFRRQPDRSLAHATFDIRVEILVAFSGEIDVHLSRAHVHREPRQGHLAKTEVPLSSSHIDFQLHGNFIVEMQGPIVMRYAEMILLVLRDGELADSGIDAVIDLWSGVRIAEAEIPVEKMAGAAANRQLPGRSLHRGLYRFGILTLHGAVFVAHERGFAPPLGERMTVPKQDSQHADQGHHRDRRSDRRIGRRTVALAPAHGIHHLAQTDKDQDQRPVGLQNGPRIEGRAVVRVQEQRANDNEDDRDGKRRPLGWLVYAHRGPRCLLVRILQRKSFSHFCKELRLSAAYLWKRRGATQARNTNGRLC